MKHGIYDTYGEFLSGKKLDVGRRFTDLSMPKIVNRIEYLRIRCTGKKVLHIGCLDHPDVILKRAKNGTWLHGIISEVSEMCVGIDVNPTGRDLVRSELDLDNIQLVDLTRPVDGNELELLSGIHWDLILCPEILEHITNHQQFLTNLLQLSKHGTILIVTVPNAFRFGNFVNTARRYESVNSDHTYSFTAYTLCRLLVQHGWKPNEIFYYDVVKSSLWLRILCQAATRLSRSFSDGIILEAEPLT